MNSGDAMYSLMAGNDYMDGDNSHITYDGFISIDVYLETSQECL